MLQGLPQINFCLFFLCFLISQRVFFFKNCVFVHEMALTRKAAVAQAGYLYGFQDLEKAYLLGLLAKIKCSICSYQLNLWYVDKSRHDD